MGTVSFSTLHGTQPHDLRQDSGVNSWQNTIDPWQDTVDRASGIFLLGHDKNRFDDCSFKAVYQGPAAGLPPSVTNNVNTTSRLGPLHHKVTVYGS